MTLGDICDSFAACKRVQDVPAAVRREVRTRMQKNHGGLLKFVEQKMQQKLSLQKDPVTAELTLTISATAQQLEQQAKLRREQLLQNRSKQQSMPAWAWNAANNNVTSFQLPSTAPVVLGAAAAATTSSSSAAAADATATSMSDGSGSFGDSSSPPEARPWNQSAARHAAETVHFSERQPLPEHVVLATLDMFAAGGSPIYGDGDHGWSYSASLTGPRVWRASEVADAFVDHVPTFWVKEKQLAKALTMAMSDVLGEMELDIEQVFERYSPQVFEIHWGEPLDPNRQQEKQHHLGSSGGEQQPQQQQQVTPTIPYWMLKNRDVRLSPFLVHERRGAADMKWQLRASEFGAEESLHAQDRQFAEVLLQNLPADGLFVHLPTWINTGLRPADFVLINSAPPQRVLMVLHQYASLFYIRAELPPKIQCVTDHFNSAAAAVAQDESGANKKTNNSNIDIWVRRRPIHLAPRCIDEFDAETSPAPELAQFILETLIEHEDKVFSVLSEKSSAKTSNKINKHTSAFSSSPLSETREEQQPQQQIVELPLPENAPRKERRGVAVAAAEAEAAATETAQQQHPPTDDAVQEEQEDGVVKCVVAQLHEKSNSSNSNSSTNNDRTGGSSSLAVWVPVPHIYRLLSKDLKSQLKSFSTLAKFLRLHGRIFCVSQDLQRVALHRWDGASQAFATVDTLLAEEESNTAAGSLLASSPGSGAVSTAGLDGGGGMEGMTPRTRKQLQHLAPDHPLLNPVKLLQAIVEALPTDRSVLVKDVFHRLPREARAALPARSPYRVLLQAPHLLTVWKVHVPDGKKRHLMVQRAELGPAPQGCGLHECATREEIVAHLQELLALHHRGGGQQQNEEHRDVLVFDPSGGDENAFITLFKLHEQLRWDAVVGVRQHFGSLEAALKAYPQLFSVERDPMNPTSINLLKVSLRK